MDKLKQILEDPVQLAVGLSGVSLVAFYLFYARNELFGSSRTKNSNALELKLKDLIKEPKHPNICKIVITESASNRFQFRGNLITRLKEQLLKYDQHILVNCSPLKLFKGGCQVFVSTLTQQDAQDEKQFMSYFENALRCQLLIEKTIVDIEQIKNKTKKTFIICDTNSLDLKVQSDANLWEKFTNQYEIDEQKLKNNYQIVFHVKNANHLTSPKMGTKKKAEKQLAQSDDEKIKLIWQGFPHYFQIAYNPELTMEENIQITVKYMMKCLQPFNLNKIVEEEK